MPLEIQFALLMVSLGVGAGLTYKALGDGISYPSRFTFVSAVYGLVGLFVMSVSLAYLIGGGFN